MVAATLDRQRADSFVERRTAWGVALQLYIIAESLDRGHFAMSASSASSTDCPR